MCMQAEHIGHVSSGVWEGWMDLLLLADKLQVRIH